MQRKVMRQLMCRLEYFCLGTHPYSAGSLDVAIGGAGLFGINGRAISVDRGGPFTLAAHLDRFLSSLSGFLRFPPAHSQCQLTPILPSVSACLPERSSAHSSLNQGVSVSGVDAIHSSSAAGLIHCQSRISSGLGRSSISRHRRSTVHAPRRAH